MAENHFEVGVMVAKRRLKGPWASHAWLPYAVLPCAPAVEPWIRLSVDQQDEIFFAGAFDVFLHPSETGHYRDNLNSGRPSLWVAIRKVDGTDKCEIAAVTADPYEGEALAEGIGEIVEPVPMPSDVRQKIAAFFHKFHQEQIFHKRKRDRADPEALARREPHSEIRGKDRS